MIERQELYCHDCGNYVQFDLDMSLNGNHVLHCPKCNHEHCRVIKNGVITSERWDSRNGPTIPISTSATSWTVMSTYSTSSGSTIMYDSWLNTTSTM